MEKIDVDRARTISLYLKEEDMQLLNECRGLLCQASAISRITNTQIVTAALSVLIKKLRSK